MEKVWPYRGELVERREAGGEENQRTVEKGPAVKKGPAVEKGLVVKKRLAVGNGWAGR